VIMANIQLRFLCFGAGAIGTYIGGSLALSGQPVIFLERPELASGLRKRGLHLSREGQDFHISDPIVVVTMEEALTRGPYDAAILAVKAFDTAELTQSLAAYNIALPPVICLQNGVENETLLASALGEDKVIPATVTTAIGRSQTGTVTVERLRGVGLSSDHILAPGLAAVFEAAHLCPKLYTNTGAMKWSKMLTNLLANASSAILDMPADAIFAHPGLFRMEMEMLREALRVMRAQGLPVIDLPGTPVRALAFLAGSLPAALSQPLLRPSLGKGRGGKMPSFHIDLHAGRGKSEVDYLNGAVVRFGEKFGVPTPVNRILTQTLLALTRGEIPIDTYAGKPDQLLALLNNQP
jgi:2-dehydropantoate 2-reductase